MGEVFLPFRQTVLPRDAALAQLDTKRVMVQTRQARGSRKRQPTARIVSASHFDLHVPLALAWTQMKTRQYRVVEL
jgi:hypothetical protein